MLANRRTDLQGLHRYILAYVDIVANANNIAYLHYLASRLKTVADATYPGDVRCPMLYTTAHTTQMLIFGVTLLAIIQNQRPRASYYTA